ncbi:MAG: hydrogenase iron-sulfur subunit [candidate division WOR-3 bacterium]
MSRTERLTTASPLTVFACQTALARLPADRGDDHLQVRELVCAGRVDAGLLLAEFEKGAERVLVLACEPPCCRHEGGAERACRQVQVTWQLLRTLGLDPAALALELVDAHGSSRAVRPEQK